VCFVAAAALAAACVPPPPPPPPPTTTTTTTTPPGPGFDIVVRMNSPASPAVSDAFNQARLRWSQVIVGDIPAVTINLPAGLCGASEPAFSGTVDDVVIEAASEPIDGVGGILGQAGPCVLGSDGLPRRGVMRFDSADLADLAAEGLLVDVVLHEMGHVLGIGTVWEDAGLLQNPSSADPRFTGPVAVGRWEALGGTGGVPVEGDGGPGTRDAHWDEAVFGNELMTGWISASPNPLSDVTIASLDDLGYQVDLGAADTYTLPPPDLRGAAHEPHHERHSEPVVPVVRL